MKTEPLKQVMKALHYTADGERQVVGIMALAGKIIYVDKVLFFKDTPGVFLSPEAKLRKKGYGSKLSPAELRHLRRRQRRDKVRVSWDMSKAILRCAAVSPLRRVLGAVFVMGYTFRRYLA